LPFPALLNDENKCDSAISVELVKFGFRSKLAQLRVAAAPLTSYVNQIGESQHLSDCRPVTKSEQAGTCIGGQSAACKPALQASLAAVDRLSNRCIATALPDLRANPARIGGDI